MMSQSCHDVRGESPRTAGRGDQGRDPRCPGGPAGSRRPGRHRDAAGRRRGRGVTADAVPLLPHREAMFDAVGDHVVARLGLPRRSRARTICAVFLESARRGARSPLVRAMLWTRLGRRLPLVAPAAAGGIHHRRAGQGDLAPARPPRRAGAGGDRLPGQPAGVAHGPRGMRNRRGRRPARYRLGHRHARCRAPARKQGGQRAAGTTKGRNSQ